MIINLVASILLLLLLLAVASTFAADDSSSTTLRYYTCSNNTFQKNSPFQENLSTLLGNLQNLSSLALYSAAYSGTDNADRVYGMFQCRGDLTLSDCSTCVSQLVKTDIPQNCPTGRQLQMWLDGCYLQYENQTFTNAPHFNLIWWEWNVDINTDEKFRQNRDSVLNTVTKAAPANAYGYNSSSAGTISDDSSHDKVYALAQCYGYLSQPDCAECLGNVIGNVKDKINLNRGGKMNFGSCYSRYEVYDFITPPPPSPSPSPSPPSPSPPPPSPSPSPPSPSPSPSPPPPPAPKQGEASSIHEKGIKASVVIGVVVGGSTLAIVLLAIVFICRRRRLPKKSGRTANKPQTDEGIMEIEIGLHKAGARLFPFHELQTVTNDFHHENKLGEGGFGPVYKGTLEDGTDVAVKKLSSTSRQGARQFLNEVRLITSVQHRNLIRLLGCCAEGSERLLVYEYLPNKSLDKHLFNGSSSTTLLDWNTRREIIVGTAKGLAYLHEDSIVCIVHRDIKASNILLDDEMNPKIADFGLARLFDEDISHVITGVAGTLGYLAPEYAIHGQLTEKVDTFSFGLLILETISGRKNVDPQLLPQEENLVEWVWRLYQEQRQLEVVDPRLGNNFSPHEIVRMVHVALLCVQMHAGLRPSMSHVVLLLSSQSDILEIPTTPVFLRANLEPLKIKKMAPMSLVSSLASSLEQSLDAPTVLTSHDQDPISVVEPR